jgi:outer membrane protein OmpA-like peptidoglycan-associated protein
MVRDRTIKADVIGHADHTGSASINNRISRRRARSVRNEIIGLGGVAGSRFRAVMGKSNTECPPAPPVNPNCRKADIFMFGYEGASEQYP